MKIIPILKKKIKIIGFIPAKKNSKDLKNKNLKKINNLSLFEIAILAAKKSKLIWIDKHGNLQSLQKRNYNDAKLFLNTMLKKNLTKFGIPKGLQRDFEKQFSVTAGDKIVNKSIKTVILKLISTNATIFSSN